MKICAGCGIKENNDEDIKLKLCTACKSVRYCSVRCQKEHRSQHKKACKKRAAELRDELLFKQPESSFLGDCPICFLPHQIGHEHPKRIYSCCCKCICGGCAYACFKNEGDSGDKCPFCRKPSDLSEEQVRANFERRAEANDPLATHQLGKMLYDKGDFRGAFELISKAAKLGSADAHFDLYKLYNKSGIGVEKDEKKMVRSLEEAAIGGHPRARVLLVDIELNGGRHKRAIKHAIIACKLGDALAVELIQKWYEFKQVGEEEYKAAVSGYQAAVEAMKSKEREEAEIEKWTQKV